jgi:hypothetical protein
MDVTGKTGSRQEGCKIRTKLCSAKLEWEREYGKLQDVSQHGRFIA